MIETQHFVTLSMLFDPKNVKCEKYIFYCFCRNQWAFSGIPVCWKWSVWKVHPVNVFLAWKYLKI